MRYAAPRSSRAEEADHGRIENTASAGLTPEARTTSRTALQSKAMGRPQKIDGRRLAAKFSTAAPPLAQYAPAKPSNRGKPGRALIARSLCTPFDGVRPAAIVRNPSWEHERQS